MAAVLSADMDHTDKVVTLIKECADIGLHVKPPDVNHSLYEFAVGGDRTIRYGLGAVRGVGRGAVEELILRSASSRGPTRALKTCAGAWICRRSTGVCWKH